MDAKLKPMSQMAEIEIADIIPNPTQPRTQFDEEALDELADSIRQLGIIQPITVKKSGDGKYIIISGERRWRGGGGFFCFLEQAHDKGNYHKAMATHLVSLASLASQVLARFLAIKVSATPAMAPERNMGA